jgi:lipid II:glycine glycyltransferase (peptidoglycan interpeptide bridge formation enzyme)
VRERPAYGSSHLLQWYVIQWAKANGSLEHDLAGCPPIDQINNPNHPLYGIGRFKTSFNKTVTQFIGAYNVSIHPLFGPMWNKGGEKLVRKLYFISHHESWY